MRICRNWTKNVWNCHVKDVYILYWRDESTQISTLTRWDGDPSIAPKRPLWAAVASCLPRVQNESGMRNACGITVGRGHCGYTLWVAARNKKSELTGCWKLQKPKENCCDSEQQLESRLWNMDLRLPLNVRHVDFYFFYCGMEKKKKCQANICTRSDTLISLTYSDVGNDLVFRLWKNVNVTNWN